MLAQFGELFAARVIQRIHPEAIAEIRYLQHHRIVVRRAITKAIHHVLVGVGDPVLLRRNVIGEHADVAGRRRRQNAAHQPRLRGPGKGGATIEGIDDRPAPQVSVLGNDRGAGRRDHGASGDARDLGGRFAGGVLSSLGGVCQHDGHGQGQQGVAEGVPHRIKAPLG
ncbi:hypothetical protein D3C81_1755550 [compost metagenome]